MTALNVIRRWGLREHLSVCAMAKPTGVAHRTVKKYLISDESEPRYARRVSSSKFEPDTEKLATCPGIEKK